MVKLIALYKQPSDPARFEEVYFGKHIPLTKQMPGLRRLECNRVTGTPRGDSPAYYLVASLYFDDAEAMAASMASEQSRAAARSLRDAGAEVTMLLATVEEL